MKPTPTAQRATIAQSDLVALLLPAGGAPFSKELQRLVSYAAAAGRPIVPIALSANGTVADHAWAPLLALAIQSPAPVADLPAVKLPLDNLLMQASLYADSPGGAAELESWASSARGTLSSLLKALRAATGVGPAAERQLLASDESRSAFCTRAQDREAFQTLGRARTGMMNSIDFMYQSLEYRRDHVFKYELGSNPSDEDLLGAVLTTIAAIQLQVEVGTNLEADYEECRDAVLRELSRRHIDLTPCSYLLWHLAQCRIRVITLLMEIIADSQVRGRSPHPDASDAFEAVLRDRMRVARDLKPAAGLIHEYNDPRAFDLLAWFMDKPATFKSTDEHLAMRDVCQGLIRSDILTHAVCGYHSALRSTSEQNEHFAEADALIEDALSRTGVTTTAPTKRGVVENHVEQAALQAAGLILRAGSFLAIDGLAAEGADSLRVCDRISANYWLTSQSAPVWPCYENDICPHSIVTQLVEIAGRRASCPVKTLGGLGVIAMAFLHEGTEGRLAATRFRACVADLERWLEELTRTNGRKKSWDMSEVAQHPSLRSLLLVAYACACDALSPPDPSVTDDGDLPLASNFQIDSGLALRVSLAFHDLPEYLFPGEVWFVRDLIDEMRVAGVNFNSTDRLVDLLQFPELDESARKLTTKQRGWTEWFMEQVGNQWGT